MKCVLRWVNWWKIDIVNQEHWHTPIIPAPQEVETGGLGVQRYPHQFSEALSNLVRQCLSIKKQKELRLGLVFRYPWIQSLVPRKRKKKLRENQSSGMLAMDYWNAGNSIYCFYSMKWGLKIMLNGTCVNQLLVAMTKIPDKNDLEE